MKLQLSSHNRQRIFEVLKVYREIEKKSLAFAKNSGIHCPEGCGACCNNPNVEVSTLEALPLAMHLWKTNRALESLELLNTLTEKRGICLFFRKDEHISWKGRCTIYKYRFLVCRLFGYYRTKDKNGNYIWGACRILKESYPSLDLNKFETPAIDEYFMRIASPETDFEGKLLPVNDAIRNALEYIGFDIQKQSWRKM
ncbi:MAG: YkgJ family cysteine cluster protein [Lentisphaerota bacterium]